MIDFSETRVAGVNQILPVHSWCSGWCSLLILESYSQPLGFLNLIIWSKVSGLADINYLGSKEQHVSAQDLHHLKCCCCLFDGMFLFIVL